jgi:hypothetical protein
LLAAGGVLGRRIGGPDKQPRGREGALPGWLNINDSSNPVRRLVKNLCVAGLVASLFAPRAFAASTPGGAKLTATINDMGAGSGSRHYMVVWITKADNTFITTLWKQGASSFTSGNWTQHFPTWETQRGSSTALPAPPDGYTSATASSYAATVPSPPATGLASNPINITWNGKDANGSVVPDGDYKFWIEYAEDFGTHGTDTGGLTTGGLTFTKGPTNFTVNPANRGTVGSPTGGNNFTSISIVWTPSVPASFNSVRFQGPNLVMSGTGPANGVYAVLTSTNADTAGSWTALVTNSMTAAGTFSYTNTLDLSVSRRYYRLRLP